MNKLVKRIAAGVSAAALLVSALSSDAYKSLFTKTVAADSVSSGKNAKSTGFNNLEQDTDKFGNYNSGYGLHTNKTAEEVFDDDGKSDGRTFDVNLESWYVGENPVDVATVLDASGSMAWTMDTLEYMWVPNEITDEEVNKLKAEYSITDKDLEKYSEINNEKTQLLFAIQDKTDNGGYLPQDVVDVILDPANTDNSKLGYDDYMYYVYEDRAEVSEFVPLGYWDGGIDAMADPSLIGYYPFSGDLKNKAPDKVNDEDAKGMLINHPESSGTYDTKTSARKVPEATFSTDTYEKKKGTWTTEEKGLDIMKTAPTGGVLLDSPTSDKFTIKMNFSIGHLVDEDNQSQYGDTTFLYITDGENYYKFYRRKDSSKNRMGIDDGKTKKQILNANKVFNASDDQEWTFEFDFENSKLNLTTSEKDIEWDKDKKTGTKWEIDLPTKLNTSNLKVILGYTDNPEDIEKFSDVYIKSVEISEGGKNIANYSFSTETKSLENSVNKKDATFVQQGDYTKPIETVYLDPVIIDNKYLDLNATSELGAVTLDAVPNITNGDGFTISMKLQKSGSLNKDSSKGSTDKQNIFYLGDKNTANNKYYQFFRSALNAGYLVLSQDQKDELNKSNNTYYQGGLKTNNEWYINTLVFEPVGEGKVKVTPYINGDSYEENKENFQNNAPNTPEMTSIEVDSEELVFLLGALQSDSLGSEHYIDDLYVFNKALDAETVKAYFGETSFTCDAGSDFTHAQSVVEKEGGTKETIDIAQINKELAGNSYDKRKGWYYVNSHSKWDDIKGCLASGKQYLGIIYDEFLAEVPKNSTDIPGGGSKQTIVKPSEPIDDNNKSIATIPSAYNEDMLVSNSKWYDAPREGNNKPEMTYDYSGKERSIRFYIDSYGSLRCFVNSGKISWTKTKDSKNKDQWIYDRRTFCSIVYKKKANDDGTMQKTKYEELNSALNNFYSNLANYSDLSNTSVVRFSTVNMVNQSDMDKTAENLKSLIMQDWTNWSDYYQADMKAHTGVEDYKPSNEKYLKDLLIPADDKEKSTDTKESAARGKDILEYPYVMTGGTYTWTGLKAFYDNMIKKDDLSSGNKVYDIANDARDKYLIIFTDGRDNTQDYDVTQKSEVTITPENVTEGVTDEDFFATKQAGSPKYDTGTAFNKKDYVGKYNPYADDTDHLVGFSIKNHTNKEYVENKDKEWYPDLVQGLITGDHKIETDGDLAQAWADKIKEEGYTIYCVMMATGSISESTNKDEYDKAYNFLRSLAGGSDEIKELENSIKSDVDGDSVKPNEIAEAQRELEELKKKHVIVVDPNKEGGTTVTDAFQQILNDIQQARDDYTVQDYIDPRFDLIGKGYTYDKKGDTYVPIKGGVIYHLGANGSVTFTDINNKPIKSDDGYVYFDNGYGSGKTSYRVNSEQTLKDIIDDTSAYGLNYVPQNSYMVNRTKEIDKAGKENYNTGDEKGTGRLYYDDEKDMYYLRWEDQVIPMADKSFDTSESDKTLDVWSATIRLKAKDDFIGGNNILTNGNEAGENLVYSEATIENMDRGNNYTLYGFTKDDLVDGKVPLRDKLQLLSGTNRKINAVDAGGVSQAVYGDGIDIPSSGFPRTTVNVRLKPLDAKNLSDVIYMGEVVSPTMMLADLENDYMTGSYYLEYLERYAYRLYGYQADQRPLLDLLNEWLKINDKTETEKTFTIPYMYLPDPVYDGDKLKTSSKYLNGSYSNVVEVSNSTGMSTKTEEVGKNKYTVADFTDLNLRDVTGFITYTWKRDDKGEEQQNVKDPADPSKTKQDITKEYIVKNTEQIKYNLELKFTPLHEGELDGFSIEDEKFIKKDTGTSGVGDSFFNVGTNYEFADSTDEKWVFTNRADYLKAMVYEQQTYKPYVEYNGDTGKWQLLTTTAEEQTKKDTYDWDKEYKPVVGNKQIEGDKLDENYTDTLNNVGFADKEGNTITDETGAFKSGKTAADVCSLVANTTYTKDIVNGALALELVVDGKYLKAGSAINPDSGTKTFTFEATRYYDDPTDPLPYGAKTAINADTGSSGKKYRLTFEVKKDSIPEELHEGQLYTVLASLKEVEVENGDGFISIAEKAEETTADAIKPYIGFTDADALPIGRYVISVADDEMKAGSTKDPKENQYYIGKNEENDLFFQYLKIESEPRKYTSEKFPDSVTGKSSSAAESTGDGEYLIKNGTADNAVKNIAESDRVRETGTQTLTFDLGTVDKKDDKGIVTEHYVKGTGVKEKKEGEVFNDYAKDRLGIILLSADNNTLSITKEVTNSSADDIIGHNWNFNVTVTTDDKDWIDNHTTNVVTAEYYYADEDGNWEKDETRTDKERPFEILKIDDISKITFTVQLKHGQKVTIKDLPEGEWSVEEVNEVPTVPGGEGIVYTAHNNMSDKGEYEWDNQTLTFKLQPNSGVDFVNEMPIYLPSSGGIGTTRYLLLGAVITSASVLFIAVLWYKRRKRVKIDI